MTAPKTPLSSIDLSKLTRQEKIELFALLEEKERRERARKTLLEPHRGQMRVVMSEALERYLFPGNGFGKTTILVHELHWAATGYHPFKKRTTPVPAKIALVLATATKVEEFLTEYSKWFNLDEKQLKKKGKPHVSFIEYDTGSTVTVITHEVTPMALEGSEWTHIFLDEPPPKQVYTALYRGGRVKDRPLQVLLAGTPIAASWLRTDIYEPWSRGELPHVECFHGSTHDNEANLDPGYIKRFSAILTEQEKAVRLEGQFFDLEGLALAHLFREAFHVVDDAAFVWEASNPCVVVIDPHPSKAHHAVLMGVDKDNRLYVLSEYKEKAIARKFAHSLIALGWFSRFRVMDIVYDSLGNAETTSGEGFRSFGEVVNEVFKENAIGRARATTYDDKSDEDFVERIRDALNIPETPDSFGQRVPKLRFLSTCTGSISDVRNVQWAQDKNQGNKPKLDIRNRDFLSCIKYGLATNLYFRKGKDIAYRYARPAYGLSINRPASARPARMRVGGLRR